MDPITTSAIIGAGASLVGGSMNMAFQGARNNKQWRYQKKAMELQNQMNFDNWNMQNEYNSPVAQMSRFQDAGLNPNLIYGSGSSNTGNSTSSPESVVATKQAPQYQADFISQSGRDYLQARMMEQSLQNKEVENRILQAQEMSIGVQLSESLLALERNQLDFDDYFLSRKNPSRKNPYMIANEQALADVRHTTTQTLKDLALGMQSVSEIHKLDAEVRKLDFEFTNILPQLKDLNDWEIKMKIKEYEKLDIANEISLEELSFLRDTYFTRLDMQRGELKKLNAGISQLESEAKRSENGIVHDWISKIGSFVGGSAVGASALIAYLKYKASKPQPRKPIGFTAPRTFTGIAPNLQLMWNLNKKPNYFGGLN